MFSYVLVHLFPFWCGADILVYCASCYAQMAHKLVLTGITFGWYGFIAVF